MADGFDHLDRNQLVEAPAQVAVVLAQHRDALRKAQRLHPLQGMGVLRFGQRRGGDAAAIPGGSMDGQAAPAGADFQQVFVGFEFQLLADAFKLVQLRLLQGLLGALELRRRVHHGWVEQAFEQSVAQVVVGQDVAP
ncbi:hypothetical protein D3C81_1758170 [compost metagenome]